MHHTAETSVGNFILVTLKNTIRFVQVQLWDIEHRSPPIPDELQLKIIGFSFPEDEQMMMKYAQFSRGGVDVSLNTARSVVGNVKNLNQIGRYDLTMVLL